MNIGKTGFTLTETLVSIALISISALLLMKCMTVSLNGLKNSNIRFMMKQSLENKKNFLLGLKRDSALLDSGNRSERSGQIRVRIRIDDISEDLKKVTLEGSGNGYKSISVFYRSEKIREVKNE